MSTSTTTLTLERRGAGWLARLADYAELTKPRISVLVLVTVAVSAYLARWGQLDPLGLLHTLIGTALVAASASALNQWLERERDARMRRTSQRPLPAGRLSGTEVIVFATLTILLGTCYLALLVNWLAAFWGLATWSIYVWIYTPLKTRTAGNTVVGAVAGALPTLLGWSAAGGHLDLRAASLFLILFLWQFPHFMAIAWIYRQQYGRAGFKMLTVVDPSGRRAGVQAVLAGMALLPVSCVPALFAPGLGSVVYLLAAFLLGLAMLFSTVAFLTGQNERTARQLLRASLIYLPALLAILMLVPLV